MRNRDFDEPGGREAEDEAEESLSRAALGLFVALAALVALYLWTP